MIYKGIPALVNEYRNSSAINQSTIKLALSGLAYYKANKDKISDRYFDEPNESMIIGSAVDCLMTMGEESFNDQYHVSTLTKKPSDTIISILKMASDKMKEDYQNNVITNTEELLMINTPGYIGMDNALVERYIIQAVAEHNYQPNWGREAILKNIKTASQEYWAELQLSHGKQILTFEQFTMIKTISDGLTRDSYTMGLFTQSPDTENNYDVFFQVPVYVTINGTRCKMLIDLIVVDHVLKQIIPYDLKVTHSPADSFLNVMKTFKYYIQGAFYTLGLELTLRWYDNICDAHNVPKELIRDLDVYSIQNFRFLVVSTLTPSDPLIYEMTDELMSIGKYGRKRSYYDTITDDGIFIPMVVPEIKGCYQGLELYNTYELCNPTHEPSLIDTMKIVDEGSQIIRVIELGWNSNQKMV